MLERAERNILIGVAEPSVRLVQADFLSEIAVLQNQYDLVLMHGSAEWMEDPDKAIAKAAGLVTKGGMLSLLVFNRDRAMLKQGINGRLLENAKKSRKKKMIPPGSRSPSEVMALEKLRCGEILCVSGIRIFYGFFRQNDATLLTPAGWLRQEKMYYRQEPFSKLGEHTHFLWRPNT